MTKSTVFAELQSLFDTITLTELELYEIQTPGIWEVFMDALPEEERAGMSCNCCKDWMRSFGSLVTVSDKGETSSPLWKHKKLKKVSENTRAVIDALNTFLSDVRVKRRFILTEALSHRLSSRTANAGLKSTSKLTNQYMVGRGGWTEEFTHFAVRSTTTVSNETTTSSIRATENQNRRALGFNIRTYYKGGPDSIAVAVSNYAKYDDRLRETQRRGIALHAEAAILLDSAVNRGNLRVKLASKDYLQINGKAIQILMDAFDGTLTDSEQEHKIALYRKATGEMYQRMQREATADNVEIFNKFVIDNDYEDSLERTLAKWSDVKEHALWKTTKGAGKPDTTKTSKPSVLDQMREEKRAASTNHPKVGENKPLPTKEMSMRDFIEVAGDFAKIEIPANRMAFGLVTKPLTDDDKPIFRWDTEENRNPYSWIVFTQMPQDTWRDLQDEEVFEVKGITKLPSEWSNFENYTGYVFWTTNKMDLSAHYASMGYGSGLFAEALHKEFYPHRRTVEELSKRSRLFDLNDSVRFGSIYRKQSFIPIELFCTDTAGTRVRIIVKVW